MFLQKTDLPTIKINPDIRDQKLIKDNIYKETEKKLNSKIRKISMKINDQYPELSKYLETMPVTIPVDKKAEIIQNGLSTYYDSLNVLLNHHIKEHSHYTTL